MHPDLDPLSVATMRTLAMDAVQKARFAHPGTPALAPVACVVWQRFLRCDPAVPTPAAVPNLCSIHDDDRVAIEGSRRTGRRT